MIVKKLNITASPVKTDIGLCKNIMLKANTDCEVAINSSTEYQTYYADELILLPLEEQISYIYLKGTTGVLRVWTW